MAIRKTLSFTDNRVVEWIEKNGGSKYVARLVIEDMKGKEKFVSREEVIKLIEDRVGKGSVENSIVECVENKSRIDKESVMGLIEF